MGSQVESASHATLMSNPHHMMGRTVPIIQASSPSATPGPGDPMEVVNPTVPSQAAVPSMGPPPARTSPETSTNGANTSSDQGSTNSTSAAMPESNQNGNMLAPSAAAGASTGTGAPKVQQTAFIHKLYNMLDDASISHLISWSPTEDSFLMSPSNDFSKVLSQYFKHTNISSFVRQLNMYGFHKVSDVFHSGSSEAQLWEFKHGNGSFKRGDIAGLRDIKRRASRHALVHRDSYSTTKPPPYSQPGTPAEMAQSPMDNTEMRFAQLEQALYDMQYRAARNEEANNALHHKNQVLQEALARSLQVTSELSRIVQSTVPSHDSVHRNVMDMQQEIDRQISVLRNLDEPLEQLYSAAARQNYFSNLGDGHSNGPPISPRQLAQDDHRRQALGQPRHALPHFNKAVPSHLSIQPRRYGSIGAQGGLSSTTTSSPSSLRYQVGAPPPLPQQVANLAIPAGANLARRHTSADIRVQTWPPNAAGYSEAGAPPPPPPQSSQWPPPSPTSLRPIDPESQRIRESFSSYSFGSASMPKHSADPISQTQARASSRPSTPPFSVSNGGGMWNWGQQGNDKFGGSNSSAFGAGQHGAHSLFGKDSALNSGPPTRRGSMAHILNPAETAERSEEGDEGREEEDRKRKRLG